MTQRHYCMNCKRRIDIPHTLCLKCSEKRARTARRPFVTPMHRVKRRRKK